MDIHKEWRNVCGLCMVETSDTGDNTWKSLNGETIDKMDGRK